MKTLLLLSIMVFIVNVLPALYGYGYSAPVVNDTVDPTLSLTRPNGGELWSIGETKNIQWTAIDSNMPSDAVDIWYSLNGGSDYFLIANGFYNIGSYLWIVPTAETYDARVRIKVTDSFGNSEQKISASPFRIGNLVPKAPEGLHLQVFNDADILVSWEHVTQTVINTPIAPIAYLVFCNQSPDEDENNYTLQIATLYNFYMHSQVAVELERIFYKVIAYISADDRVQQILDAAAQNPELKLSLKEFRRRMQTHSPALESYQANLVDSFKKNEPEMSPQTNPAAYLEQDAACSHTILSTAPVVNNVIVSQRLDGSKTIDIWYDLYDQDADLCDISVSLSPDNGVSWGIIPNLNYMTGDVGENLASGTNKHIVWNAGAQGVNLDGSYIYRIYADEHPGPVVPVGFAFVEGGTFHNGVSNVTLSSYYIAQFECTQSDYEYVMGVNPASWTWIVNAPVNYVNWFDAIEYCNKRSIMEGLMPCYTYAGFGTNPLDWPAEWKDTYINQENISCSWTANGYRLPTEAEWHFAARGGTLTHNYTYSGGNSINSVAWYVSNSSNKIHTVGTKAQNELGIFDMSGNVWEICWDRYGSYAPGPQTNPHGPATGDYRVMRGGSWYSLASNCEVSFKQTSSVTGRSDTKGFRVCRSYP